MKKYLSLLLALVLLLPGCGKKADETTGQDAETIVKVMLYSLEESQEEDLLSWYREPSEVEAYLTDFYKLEDTALLDGAIVRMEGARAFELAVLQLSGADGDSVTGALHEYLLDRQGAFTGYFPAQADLAAQGLTLAKGAWAALIVCQDTSAAKQAFETCFGEGVNAQGTPAILESGADRWRPDGRLRYVDPQLDDMTLFDSSAILAAWESGDRSALSEQDKQVLDAAEQVVEQWTRPGASGLEYESGVYAWLTTHVSYDQSHYSKQGAPRTSYEPYGPLINGTGVCLGYATTFQLLMDMAGIECITVTGASFGSQQNHAWNMVRLNGEWYCVDATWDHNGFDGDFTAYQELKLDQYRHYFNVTSDYMAQTDHQWDYDSVPEATADDFGQP